MKSLKTQGQENIRAKWNVCIKLTSNESEKIRYANLRNEELANHLNLCITQGL